MQWTRQGNGSSAPGLCEREIQAGIAEHAGNRTGQSIIRPPRLAVQANPNRDELNQNAARAVPALRSGAENPAGPRGSRKPSAPEKTRHMAKKSRVLSTDDKNGA
jgi:hypothetical protein